MKSIRIKLIFWISVLFVFMGLAIYIPLSNILPKMVISQILKRDVEIAKYISNEAEDSLLLDDRINLSILLYDNLDRLEDARYLFIQTPDRSIISHTFTKGFPKGLLSLGEDMRSSPRIKEFLSSGKKIYDIAIPILKGEIGTLHLGVSMESSRKDIAAISKINYYVAGILLVSLGAGIFIFLTMGFLFSNQIIELKNFASKIGKGQLDEKIEIKSKDEIGALASAFNNMALRLKEKIEEIKRLNTLEERNRIAFDLHDSCAQDLANIIKRLELCERLFKIDEQKAFSELTILRNITKDVLDRTRQIIFNLKSSKEIGKSNLANQLTDYIKDYREENNINVRLSAPPYVDIPAGKSNSIFYIAVEALTNIKKHSQARNVALNLELDDQKILTINIEDDGNGFDKDLARDPASSYGKLGLVSMRERAYSLGGTFSINSEPSRGTKISVKIPLGDEALKGNYKECQIT